jgi:hypothetical protein
MISRQVFIEPDRELGVDIDRCEWATSADAGRVEHSHLVRA